MGVQFQHQKRSINTIEKLNEYFEEKKDQADSFSAQKLALDTTS